MMKRKKRRKNFNHQTKNKKMIDGRWSMVDGRWSMVDDRRRRPIDAFEARIRMNNI